MPLRGAMRLRHFCHCHARLRRARFDKGEGKYEIATPPLREARNDKAADPLKLDCHGFSSESLAMTDLSVRPFVIASLTTFVWLTTYPSFSLTIPLN
jgi:hypothetical protein